MRATASTGRAALAATVLASLVIMALVLFAWTLRGVLLQRELDATLARSEAELRRLEYVLKRSDELQALGSRLQAEIMRLARPRAERPARALVTEVASRWPGVFDAPDPITWNPFAQGAAVQRRRDLLDARLTAIQHGILLEKRLPDLERKIETVTADLARLEAMAKAQVAPAPP